MLDITVENVLKKIREAGSDDVLMFGGEFTGGYHIQQNPNELAELIVMLNQLISQEYRDTYLEIGAASGGTTRMIQECLGFREVYIIDDMEHPMSYLREQNMKWIKPKEFQGDSHSEECKEWLRKNMNYIDCVFIDGDHSYEGVKQDFELVFDLVAHGGIIILHDTMANGDTVGKFVTELILGEDVVLYEEIVGDMHTMGIGVFIKIA